MIKTFKKIGQTPLELLDDLRVKNPDLKNEKLSYAGRLDPMAFGEMLILVGAEENSDREKYLGFDKTYTFKVLFGYQTDTGDLLGLIEGEKKSEISKKELKKALKELKKLKEIAYPYFSSKTVKGKPLFEWYKSGKINHIDIPKREIEIKNIKLIDTFSLSSENLLNYISKIIPLVKGDFRQDEIIDMWTKKLSDDKNLERNFQVAEIKIKASSGTYIRSIVNELGSILNIKACVLTLERNKIHN